VTSGKKNKGRPNSYRGGIFVSDSSQKRTISNRKKFYPQGFRERVFASSPVGTEKHHM